MKKYAIAGCLAVALILPTGCVKATSTTPAAALAPGFSSQADQTMDQVLVGANVFYTTVQKDIAAGTYTPSPTEKTALDSFALALNSAQVIYMAFHNGTATQAAAQTAVNNVQSQQTALQSTITAVK